MERIGPLLGKHPATLRTIFAPATTALIAEAGMVDQDDPGAFDLAEHGKLAQVFRDARATEVRERIFKFQG